MNALRLSANVGPTNFRRRQMKHRGVPHFLLLLTLPVALSCNTTESARSQAGNPDKSADKPAVRARTAANDQASALHDETITQSVAGNAGLFFGDYGCLA